MNNDTIEIVITVKKSDLQAAIEKLGITEYHFKDSKVFVDMQNSFKQAVAEATKKESSDGELF